MQKIIQDMRKKHLPILIALIPSIAAISVIAKMSQDQKAMLSSKQEEISLLTSSIEAEKKKLIELNQLCPDSEDCSSLITRRIIDAEEKAQLLTAQMKDKEREITEVIQASTEKDAVVSELQTELRKTKDSLRLTRQTVDAQVSIQLEDVEEQIEQMQAEYKEVISNLQQSLESSRLSSELEIKEKEEKFKELHKKSINNLLGMVDSLAQDRESRIIPLISNYDDKSFKQRFVCSDRNSLNPSDMIFSNHMDRHWMTWPITVISSNQEVVEGKTNNGFDIALHWENTNNMYELVPGDNIVIQFQPEAGQDCHGPIIGKRAVLTTH